MIIQKQVTVGERGQIVIPKEIREQEHIEPNQIVTVIDIAGNIKIIVPRKEKKKPEELIMESLKESDLTEEDWEEIQKEREERF